MGSDLEAFSHNPTDDSSGSHSLWWVNKPTLTEFRVSMIGISDIEGSKSNAAMNA
ncbi:MAG: hypothetical protein J3R72DRAFT_516267 [Linnemannia gamsii]|nr:MAG: hypothetical protein J3R72DRAFT_516267 [Linnemannia gamsii]